MISICIITSAGVKITLFDDNSCALHSSARRFYTGLLTVR